jgi:hypothetical protein
MFQLNMRIFANDFANLERDAAVLRVVHIGASFGSNKVTA